MILTHKDKKTSIPSEASKENLQLGPLHQAQQWQRIVLDLSHVEAEHTAEM